MSRKSIVAGSMIGIGLLIFGASVAMSGCGGIEAVDESAELDDNGGKADSQYGVKLSAVAAGEVIQVTVTNSTLKTAIYLPGCNAVSLELEQDGVWVPVAPERTCVFEGLVVMVAAQAIKVEALAAKPAGTYRAKIEFKTGCKASQPLSQCTGKLRSLTSASFTVADPACGDLEDWAYDNCVPDDDDPVNWDGCFANSSQSEGFARQCCQADPGFLWCADLPAAPAAAACNDFEDWAYDNCVPDDDAPVDWSWCFSNYEGGFGLGAQCCQANPGFLWCSR